MSAAPRPGWYRDPAGSTESPSGYRWWDGASWTDATSESPRSPAPVLRPVAPGPIRTVLLVTLSLTLFVGASVSVGMLLRERGDSAGAARSASTSPASRTPAGTSSGQLDLHSRVATIGSASLTLPDAPYDLIPYPRDVSGLFDVFFMANAPVHERYDGTRTWAATVMLARLVPSPGGAGLESQGKAALRRLSTTIFDGHATTLADVRWSDRSVSSCAGLLLTGRVAYAVAQLPSHYDTVTALLVQLPDGSRVMAVTSVPDDTDAYASAQASAALASLTVH